MFDRFLPLKASFEYSNGGSGRVAHNGNAESAALQGATLQSVTAQSVTAVVQAEQNAFFPGDAAFPNDAAPEKTAPVVATDSGLVEVEAELSQDEQAALYEDEDEDEGSGLVKAAGESIALPYAGTSSGSLRHAEFDALFREWRRGGDPRLRDRLILMNRSLVAYLARRFVDRGEMSEDLMQHGLIGLINALDAFDPERGARFVTFATPTIMGEMRRYLRDKTWGIRVPRRLHELNGIINHRIELLAQEFDRSPTYFEIAHSLGLEVEEVIEALELVNNADPLSIDETMSPSANATALPISEQVGELDADLESWNDHASLRAALDNLDPRERQVLEMVYFQGRSQLEVAREMKVSQMHISRVQRRALSHLREFMSEGES